jgi:hypothetical protein
VSKLGPFLWFGAPPRQPLPALGDRIARQARVDATGTKARKPNHRVVGRGRFEELGTMENVVEALFDPLEGC